jgi:hypothetical protein
MSFSSAQRLARAAVLGGWDAALRVGLGSREAEGAASVLLLRGAGYGNIDIGSFGLLLGVVSAVALARWLRRREGEEGMGGRGREVVVEIAAAALGCASVVFGDGGRTGGEVSRFRGRAGIGLGRWVRVDLYDVGRRIWRARLCKGRISGSASLLRCGVKRRLHLRDGTKGHLCPVHLEPFLESACWEAKNKTQ